MKAILYFRLPEDQLSFDIASRSVEIRDALSTFSKWLEAMRIDEKRLDKKSLQIIEAEFRGILDDHGIELETY